MQEKMREYARLLVRVGLNVQKGQTLVISSPVECAWFARMCAEEAYEIPCREVVMNWTDDAMARMKELAKAVTVRHYGRELEFAGGSTDCNIPLSRGVPALCLGCYRGRGAHTREEYVEIDSLFPGSHVAFEMILHHF